MKSPKQPASHWLTQKWGALVLVHDQELPESWGIGTHRKLLFLCEVCGKTRFLIFNDVNNGRYTTCGHCSEKGKSYWLDQTWGSLRLDPDQELPESWGSSSTLKLRAICTCGKATTRMGFRDLVLAQSCGKCSWKSAQHWLDQTWGSLRLDPDQGLPDFIAPSSNKGYSFLCMCGKPRSIIPFYKITNGRQTTCGHCSDCSKDFWLAQQWNHLRLSPDQVLKGSWSANSADELRFVCDCTRRALIQFKSVSRGHTKTCGKCNFKTKDHWQGQRWGKLLLNKAQKLPDEWSPGTEIVFEFICDCGRNTSTAFCRVTSGHVSSCGVCSYQSKEYWLSQRWGKLKLDPNQELPSEWGKGSEQKVLVQCDCGRSSEMRFYALTIRNRECGKCSSLSREYWLQQRWGSLTLLENQELPDEWQPFSTREFVFDCSSCGKQATKQFQYVYSGNAESCGTCSRLGKDEWLTKQWGKLRIDPNQSLPNDFVPSGTQLNFVCECREDHSNVVSLILDNVISGNTKSCGCLKPGENEFSPEAEVRDFVKTLAPDTYPTSYLIEGTRRKYDIYVPSKKLAIEYHGLPWHSEKFNEGTKADKDYKKYLIACERGDRLIQIYGDEWETKQEIIKAQLKDLLSPEKKSRIKPVFEVITGHTPSEVRTFLNQNHYLGAASGCVTVVAKAPASHGSAVVGAWVFMKRETGVILWHRACWDRAYKSWNPHEKALTLALPALREMGFTTLLTFADNRFHTGNLYAKLGFKFEKEIAPEYYYTNNNVRKSKYALRVPAGVNEVESARDKGWYRIWDSGKKRYSLYLI